MLRLLASGTQTTKPAFSKTRSAAKQADSLHKDGMIPTPHDPHHCAKDRKIQLQWDARDYSPQFSVMHIGWEDQAYG